MKTVESKYDHVFNFQELDLWSVFLAVRFSRILFSASIALIVIMLADIALNHTELINLPAVAGLQ